jgi:hypothetical protein
MLPLFLWILSGSATAQWSGNPEANTAVSRETGDQTSPLIVSDGNGGAFIVWPDARDGAVSDVYAQRLDAYGEDVWEADGIPVCTADSAQTPVALIADGAGGAIIIWTDHRAGNDDLYAQRLDASGVALWTANGVPVAAGPGDREAAVAVADGAGGAFIVWKQDGGATLDDILAQRLTGGGTVAWSPAGEPVCTDSASQDRPRVAADGAGGALVVWTDERDGGTTQKDIYAQLLSGPGVPQWTVDGVPLCAAPGDQDLPVPVADGAGGLIAAWEDDRGADQDVYAQRLNSSGTPQWTADGVAVCAAAENQQGIAAISDDAGGVIIAWVDQRSALTAPDVYTQRVSPAGAQLWTPAGVPLCTATGTQDQAALTSSLAGGAVVVWRDARGGADLDLYGVRIDGTGALLWSPDGAAVSTARDPQEAPAIATDGAGGAIVVWQDSRQLASRGFDIYAQKVNASGVLGLPTPRWTAVYNNAVVNKLDGMGFKVRTAAKTLSRSLGLNKRGDVFVTGYSDGGTSKVDYLTVKYDLNGVKRWEARYNGTAGKKDLAYAIVVDDDAVYVTGESQGVDSGFDLVTVKYDTAGGQLWTARYHNPLGGKKDAGYDIALVGGEEILVVTGETDAGAAGKANIVTIAYNSETGAQLWIQEYSGPGGKADRAWRMETFSLPGNLDRVVVVGESEGAGTKSDYVTLVYDAVAGTPLWSARYNGPTSGKDQAFAVAFDRQEDAIFVTGGSEGPTKFDFATVRYDLTGVQQWVARYNNGAVGKSDIAYDLVLGENEELFVCGASESAGKFDYTTVKYSATGTELWVNRYDGGIGKKDFARAAAYDDEAENLFVTGSSEQGAGRKFDYLTQRIDGLTGVTEWVGRYNGTGAKNDIAYNVAVRPGGGSLTVTGSSLSAAAKMDIVTVTGPVDSTLPGPVSPPPVPDDDAEEADDEDWEDILEGEADPQAVVMAAAYPNPFNPQTVLSYWLPTAARVRLTVYDLLGREVARLVDDEQAEGVQESLWDASGSAAGVYFYRIEVRPRAGEATGFTSTGKLMLLR